MEQQSNDVELMTHSEFINLVELSKNKDSRDLAVGIAFGLLSDRAFPTNDVLLNYYIMTECNNCERRENNRSELNNNTDYIINSWRGFWDYAEKWPAFIKDLRELYKTK